MRRTTRWQVAALVVLAVVWLAWRWVWSPQTHDLRAFTGTQTDGHVTDVEPDVPAWTGLPDWPAGEPGDESDFADARLERERARSLIMEVLYDVVADEKTDEVMRREAQHRLIALAEAGAAEREVEQLLKGQGWGPVMCYVYPRSAVVVTMLETVVPKDAARIMDVAATVTGLDWEAITVIGRGNE